MAVLFIALIFDFSYNRPPNCALLLFPYDVAGLQFYKMILQFVTETLLLHLIAASAFQFMPPPFQYPYPPGPQMPMMQMPNGPQVMQMPNSPQVMPMPNGSPVMQMPNQPPMMPHLPRLPGMPSGPMPLPMSLPINGGRLPMVVMPHYSKKADKPRRKPRKPKRKRINMESSSSEGSCSESEAEYRARNSLRSSKRRRQVLTPVVSYVTKDGYVVYQKKIKKDKAKDWLDLSKGGSGEFKDKIRLKKREH